MVVFICCCAQHHPQPGAWGARSRESAPQDPWDAGSILLWLRAVSLGPGGHWRALEGGVTICSQPPPAPKGACRKDGGSIDERLE